MKRIGLTGAMLALLLFGTSAGAYAQQDNQDKEHGNKHDKQNKDEKDKKKADKDKGDADAASKQQAAQAQQALQAQQAQQQALQAQQAQAAQAAQAAQQHPPQPQPAIPPGRQRAQHGAANQPNGQLIDQQRQQQAAQHQQELARQQEQIRLQQQQNQANQQQLAQQQIAIEQQRASQYQNNLDQQLRVIQAQNAQLEQQNRRSQYQAQQQYAQALQEQQQRIRNERNYDYNGDPFYHTASTYRYTISGQTRRTNRYGADLLRQAVNYGYDQGYRAGEADRMDHWGYKYRDAFAYRDANYGYSGRYVSQSDYNYYFRQGFRRGYEDSYYRRAKYGRRSNGKTTIFSVTISGILNLRVIR